jgi:hypothetical protein
MGGRHAKKVLGFINLSLAIDESLDRLMNKSK